MRRPPRSGMRKLLVLGLLLSGACREQETATTPVADGDPVRRAQLARLEAYRATIGERARQGCAGFVESEPELEAACIRALEDVYRDVGRRIESAPTRWEEPILGLARSCLREANERSKLEGTGESPGTLFLKGLADVPACLDRQLARLAEQQADEPPAPRGG